MENNWFGQTVCTSCLLNLVDHLQTLEFFALLPGLCTSVLAAVGLQKESGYRARRLSSKFWALSFPSCVMPLLSKEQLYLLHRAGWLVFGEVRKRFLCGNVL